MTDDYDARLKTALLHLSQDVPVPDLASPANSTLRKSVTPKARTALPAGALVAVVVLAVAVILIPAQVWPWAGGPASASPSPARATPDPFRYQDGIPRTWKGEPVLRGQAALDAANASTDASPFLVAFWAGFESAHSCPAVHGGDSALYLCGGMGNVGDMPGVVSGPLGMALRVNLAGYEPGPFVVRVHTHDPQLASCPAAYSEKCIHTMVGEAVEWSGDQATSARPYTLVQAAEAFGVPAKPSSANVCMASGYPGAPVLEYPAGNDSSTVEAVVIVFPSETSLAAVSPSAASQGETDVPPTGHQDCYHFGADPLRGNGSYSIRVRWLARGNVLVGVQYDTSLGPTEDPFVRQVRVDLAKLPTG